MKSIKHILLIFIKKIFLTIILVGVLLGGPLYLLTPSGSSDYWERNNDRTPVLTWSITGVNTSTSITISWETDKPTSSVVEYGFTSNLGEKIVNETKVKFHVIKLTGLKPNSIYYYRVSSLKGLNPAISKIYSFKTAALSDQPLRFAIYGDTRDPVNGLQAVANAMLAKDNQMDFTVHVGDLVGEGGKRGLWNQFFKRTSEINARIPFVPVIGNHEFYGEGKEAYADSDFPELNASHAEHYLKYFNLPGNEHYYSLNFSDKLHYIVLDSNEPGSYFYRNSEINKNAQAQWLYDDLIASNSSFDWIFVSYHHPENRYQKYNITTQTGPRSMTINEIFHESGVDIVVVGHYHTYERQWFKEANRTIPYIINGGGGADLDGILCWDPNTDKANEKTIIQYNDVFCFSYVVIDGTHLKLETYDIQGNLIDSLEGDSITGWQNAPTNLSEVDY